ncbi:MAG: alpha/beta hydrolase [Mycobacteriaceae bacterium]
MSIAISPKLLAPFVKIVSKWIFSEKNTWDKVRKRQSLLSCLSRFPDSISISKITLSGISTDLVVSNVRRPEVAVLYLHGGGYTTGSPGLYWNLTSQFSSKMNAAVYIPDYRLAPEFPYPSAIEDAIQSYQVLLDLGWDPSCIVVAGDSAGGALALNVALSLKEEGSQLPACLVLICPATDFRDSTIAKLDKNTKDSILTLKLLQRFMKSYAPDHADSIFVSPLLADLTGLPPIIIDAASNDLICSMARDLRDKAENSGVRVHYSEHKDFWHDFQIMTGLLNQADRAVENIINTMKSELGLRGI